MGHKYGMQVPVLTPSNNNAANIVCKVAPFMYSCPPCIFLLIIQQELKAQGKPSSHPSFKIILISAYWEAKTNIKHKYMLRYRIFNEIFADCLCLLHSTNMSGSYAKLINTAPFISKLLTKKMDLLLFHFCHSLHWIENKFNWYN